jgi:hypothetical protein
MVFLWTGLAHVLFHLPAPLLPQSGRPFGHWEQAKVILGDEEDMESVQSHGEWDITEYPLQNTRVGEIRGWENPVLRSDDLREGLDLPLVN